LCYEKVNYEEEKKIFGHWAGDKEIKDKNTVVYENPPLFSR
jgi:hypothetical protein